MIDSPYMVKPGSKVKLKKISTDDTSECEDRDEAEKTSEKNLQRIGDLQDILYAESTRAVLVVLQAMDAGGKDGTIRHIFSACNPQGCQVTSFKAPSTLEKAHDFLWRIHDAAPPKGLIGIFNRSHYESVLVERIHDLAPKSVWKKRYDHINAFEEMLVDEGTLVLKFFLHISKKEQAERLQARLDDPKKNWKFNPGDLKERELWDEYQDAYEDVLERCSTEAAPWYIIPADKKWYRNYVISDIIARAMKDLDPQFPKPVEDLSQYRIST